ncbi:hypothetical protein [Acidithiobacillus thiooxidans]|uniref:Uncharacterized protein n=1 Tax=Acidithiobacillus thiooxidans TaxID=930 RepID=A0A1C2HYX9_ACITH|nr:hypothetical protein [Acidithiobacillus thiooxidans]OCX68924.1 hypothetical protein A6M23_16540 [Acidithiobacillus thiooxidans]OCX82126.1 hypothetical protein A6P08_12640 [Acidithiobacillus thiooxidans]
MRVSGKKGVEAFFQERRKWDRPNMVINPIGTLVIHDGKQWVCAPWIESFMMKLRGELDRFPEPLVMLSIPAEKKKAGKWDLVLLESGLSKYFGKRDFLWPEDPPLRAVVALENIGYPPSVWPRVYVDVIPDRIKNTFNDGNLDKPGKVIYWRPSDAAIKSMACFGVKWTDREDDLLDIERVSFAGQPEDVISVFWT